MGQYKKVWLTLVGVLILGFGILGYYGAEIYRSAPPIPEKFVSQSGEVIATKDEIIQGQLAWQSTGGMQIGSVWGHGAYQAPDWTADFLHKEIINYLDIISAKAYSKSFDELSLNEQGALKEQLKREFRTNTFENGVVTLSDERVEAIKKTASYYIELYGDNKAYQSTRESFAMKENTLPSLERRENLSKFFFWTAWTASTNRPRTDATYTNNWPHEPLIDNVPTPENVLWSIISIVILVAGVGFLIWFRSFYTKESESELTPPKDDPLVKLSLTPSQKALGKYLFVVVALFLFQVLMGGLVTHYTVEGQAFFGVDFSAILPYSLARTWHIQAAVLWIATAFLAAGLFLGPVVNGGKDPKFQKLGVDILFWALIFVTAGSFLGNFLAVMQKLPLGLNFLLGHQGYEFIELGRLWQILLFVGLLVWLMLLGRTFIGAYKQDGDKNLLTIFFASIIAVALFYAPGLFYKADTHISVMEYWRWWVVHLWVEGFFEVFATAALAFVFVNLGLVSKKSATFATIAAASIFMIGGIPGTFHHLYFAGTTTPVMAVGASFSALEVVPLVLLGAEAFEHWRLQYKTPWMASHKWAIYCFVAVAFWNMLGAGVFGFLINPPISLYYIQGLNTTPVHSHAALFGVYGFLSLGFVLTVLRYLRPDAVLSEKMMKIGFWSLNLGLVLMIATTLLPIGLFQAHASISVGMWYARSEEFLQQEFLETLRWLRIIGDSIFILGAVCFFIQVTKLTFCKCGKNKA